MSDRMHNFKKVTDMNAHESEGTVPFNEVAAMFIKKRDKIAKEIGVEPEQVQLGAYKLVFVIGNSIRTKRLEGHFICSTCAVKGGYEALAHLVDNADDD